MTHFRKDEPGFLYLVESKDLKAKKIGITNNIAGIDKRFGKSWEMVGFLYSESGISIARAEQVVLQAIRMAQESRNLLSSAQIKRGHTETFSANLASLSVYSWMKRSLKQSLKIHGLNDRIVTHKMYNKKRWR